MIGSSLTILLNDALNALQIPDYILAFSESLFEAGIYQ
jgi:hypothetical protein